MDRYLTAKEVAQVLEISIAQAYTLMGMLIPVYYQDRKRMVREDDLIRFMESDQAKSLRRRPGHRTPEEPPATTTWMPFPGFKNGQKASSIELVPKPGRAEIAGLDIVPNKENYKIGFIINTNSSAAVEWLRRRGIEGPILPKLHVSDVQNKHLITHSAPLWILRAALTVSFINAPLFPWSIGTIEDLEKSNPTLVTLKLVPADFPKLK